VIDAKFDGIMISTLPPLHLQYGVNAISFTGNVMGVM
jgi:hypothetical protein